MAAAGEPTNATANITANASASQHMLATDNHVLLLLGACAVAGDMQYSEENKLVTSFFLKRKNILSIFPPFYLFFKIFLILYYVKK